MYMHQFRQTAPKRIPELKIGKKYQVVGYHTGDFVGELTQNDLLVATFKVKNELVEVLLDSAVKIREI